MQDVSSGEKSNVASRAYRPGETLTPFSGWTGQRRSTLQTDLMLVDADGGVGVLDRDAVSAPNLNRICVSRRADQASFKANYAQWLQDSLFDSLPDRIKRHNSYRAIVQEGDRVVPLIAAELRREPSFLFLALEDITGHDPVPQEAEGDLQATIDAWLSWLRK